MSSELAKLEPERSQTLWQLAPGPDGSFHFTETKSRTTSTRSAQPCPNWPFGHRATLQSPSRLAWFRFSVFGFRFSVSQWAVGSGQWAIGPVRNGERAMRGERDRGRWLFLGLRAPPFLVPDSLVPDSLVPPSRLRVPSLGRIFVPPECGEQPRRTTGASVAAFGDPHLPMAHFNLVRQAGLQFAVQQYRRSQALGVPAGRHGAGSFGGLFQQASEIACERNGSTGYGILVARHDRVTCCCGFHLQLFLPQKIADKFARRGIVNIGHENREGRGTRGEERGARNEERGAWGVGRGAWGVERGAWGCRS